MNLDPQQTAAVKTDSRRALVLAGAGSGKTRVLIERIAYLIEEQKVSPYEVMAFTFTRRAAGEIKSRLEERIGHKAYNVTLGTMHALALNMINRFGEVIGLKSKAVTVYSQWEEEFLLKDVAQEMGLFNGKAWKIPKKDVMAVFDAYYQRGIEPEEDSTLSPIFRAFIQRCRENNSLTHGGLLIGLRLLIPTLAKYTNIKHILVDEVQDIDHLQWAIILEMEKAFGASLFVVGDVDQCQPAGTMVLLSDGSEIPIEQLNPEIHELRAYDKHDALIYGGHNKGYKFAIKKNYYADTLLTVEAGGKKTRCTTNHKWWVKWSCRSREKNVVYLMRKGDRFRVGWCQLFRSGGNVHLLVRSHIEKADDVWMLKVFDSKKEASLYEQIISVNYGIPTIMFTPKETTPYYDEEGIDYVFGAITDLPGSACRCLQDHGRNIAFPFWSQNGENKKQGNNHVFGVVACNLIPGLFKVPVRDGMRNILWEEADLSVQKLDIPEWMYSLDVEKYHTYVADGICTRNSIYEWRGAAPKYLVDHQEEFDIYRLEANYRSMPEIVTAANNLISHNRDRITKTMIAKREESEESLAEVLRGIDSLGLVSFFGPDQWSSTIEGGMAILARTHSLLQKIDRLMEEAKIPHEYIGRNSALTNSEPFRRFHAFLKLAVNPYDNFSFLLIKDIVGISREEYGKIRIRAAERGESHFQAWMVMSCDDATELFTRVPSEIDPSGLPVDMGFAEYINDKFPSLSPEAMAFIKQNQIGNGSIESYLSWLATYEIQDEMKEDRAGIMLMTVHAAKGLEWPVVILAGCNEGIIPSKQALVVGDLEAERRLMYVAMTRAKDQLVMTVRPEVTEGENGVIFESPASRFIAEAGL